MQYIARYTHTRGQLRTERIRARSHAELIFVRLSCHFAFGFVTNHKGETHRWGERDRSKAEQRKKYNKNKNKPHTRVTKKQHHILCTWFRKLLLLEALINNAHEMFIGFGI